MKQAVTLSTSLLIDPTKEPLRQVQPFYRGVTHIPSDIEGPALMVFIELQRCFQKAGNVSEGLLHNLIWGFEQCGYHPQHVAAGLTQLRNKGYLVYKDPSGSPVADSGILLSPPKYMWVTYSPKFLELLYKGEGHAVTPEGGR